LILCAELEVSKKQSEVDKKKIEELTRERDLLSKVSSNISDIVVIFTQVSKITAQQQSSI